MILKSDTSLVMRPLFTLFCVFLSMQPLAIFSQDLVLNSQTKVDAFTPIGHFPGSITLQSTDVIDPIVDLNPLSFLTSVGGDLTKYKSERLI